MASVSFIDASGQFVAVPRRPRIADLSVVPSPFLEGVFAPLMESHPGTAWRTVWETNRGCPFKCTFCDWGSAIAAKVHRFELDRIYAEAEWIASNGIDYLFIGDANFGILPRDVEIAEAVVAAAKRHGYPKKVLVQQTKNATDRAYLTMKTIAEGGLATEMNISIQTTTPEVLEAIKRQNISLETYAELQRRFVHDGIPTFVDMIVGLPAETLQSFKESISSVIERGQHHRVQFHNLTILPNAEMGDPEYQRQYALKTVTCKIVNNHASADAPPDGIYETQELVVSSSSFDEEGWREMRSFSWLTLLYHMHHVLLPSILVTWKLSGLPIWRAIDALVQADPEQCPTLAEMRRFCLDFAGRMQGGGDEYVYSEDWLDQFWTVDEYLLIRLCLEDRLADLYAEARETLMPLLPPATAELDPSEALGDAIRLNEARMRHPLSDGRVVVHCDYDVHAFCEAVLQGEEPVLRREPISYEIEHRRPPDLDAWLLGIVRDRAEDKLAEVVETQRRPPRRFQTGTAAGASSPRSRISSASSASGVDTCSSSASRHAARTSSHARSAPSSARASRPRAARRGGRHARPRPRRPPRRRRGRGTTTRAPRAARAVPRAPRRAARAARTARPRARSSPSSRVAPRRRPSPRCRVR